MLRAASINSPVSMLGASLIMARTPQSQIDGALLGINAFQIDVATLD